MSYRNDLEAAQLRAEEAERRAEKAEIKNNNHMNTHNCVEKTKDIPRQRKNWFPIAFVIVIILTMGGFIFIVVDEYNVHVEKTARLTAQVKKQVKEHSIQAQTICEAYAPIAWPNLKCDKVSYTGPWMDPCYGKSISLECLCHWKDGMIQHTYITKKLCLLPPEKKGNRK